MFVDGPKVEVWRPPTSGTLKGGSWITSNWFERTTRKAGITD